MQIARSKVQGAGKGVRCEVHGTRYKVHVATRCKMQGSRFGKVQDAIYKKQGASRYTARCKVQSSRCKVEHARLKAQGARCS